MPKTILKTVERKTSVSREAITKAFAEVRAERKKDTDSKLIGGSISNPKSGTKKKSN